MTNDEIRAAAERIEKNDYMLSMKKPYPTPYDDAKLLAQHYLSTVQADDGESVNAEWLLTNGFLPDGDDKSLDFGLHIWEKGQTESYGEEPAMQVLVSLKDHSVWLETYDTNGDTLCLIELPIESTHGQVRKLVEALGVR